MANRIQSLKDILTSSELSGYGLEIPWSDPDFSRRILIDQLNPDNDIAGRRANAIDQFVQFVHFQLLTAKETRILDIGCGPGLYSHRLARLGHHCTGIDISPAAIEYAEKTALEDKLDCRFIRSDFLETEFELHNGLITLTFGDFNTFSRATARNLLTRLIDTIKMEGILLLEVLTEEGILNIAEREANWSIQTSGIFSDQPHLLLDKYHFNEIKRTAEADYFIIDDTGSVKHYGQQYAQYTDDEYQQLLLETGFDSVEFYPGFGPGSHDFADDLQIIVARK